MNGNSCSGHISMKPYQETNLKISVAGLRGIVGKTLSPSVITDFARSFVTCSPRKSKIVIGKDTRPSGEVIKQALVSALSDCQIIDAGICPVPTLLLLVKKLKANGGIMITASHNPVHWNGLKFISAQGTLLGPSSMEKIINIYQNKRFRYPDLGERPSVKTLSLNLPISLHLTKILKYVDTDLIRKRKFRVVLDCSNGAGSLVTPALLKELDCQVTVINDNPSGMFPCSPDLRPEGLSYLRSLVKSTAADIGFAQDPDADRLAIVSEKGEYVTPDYVLALAAQQVLKKEKGPVVVNQSTSQVIDDISYKHDCPVIRSKTGEANVVETMKKVSAIVGGEGNCGGIIVPQINYGRDSLAGIGVILQYLAETSFPVSSLIATLPQYKMCEMRINYPPHRLPFVFQKLKQKYCKEKINTQDGIKISFTNSWVVVRPSNTESVVRIIAEAKINDEARSLCQKIRSYFV